MGYCGSRPYFAFVWTWRRFRSMPQSLGLLYIPIAQLASAFAAAPDAPPGSCAHDLQFGSPGFVLHGDVPRGGLKVVAIQLKPCWPSDRTSISESFSSDRTMIATSESGRRKSWRWLMIVVSTPRQTAMPVVVSIES